VPSRSRGEYVPPHLRDAMTVTRLANAEWAANTGCAMRYVVACNVHEGIDPDQPIRVLDSQDGTYLNVADLSSRLSEESRKWFLSCP